MLQEVKKCQRKDSMCDDIEMVDGATGGSTSLAAVAMELERTKSELEDLRKALMVLPASLMHGGRIMGTILCMCVIPKYCELKCMHA